mmetsp:Transcript_28542/g.25262  ORF Transcript_28542/g.25262 Transcript_28542/m.25262 type:complete len:90 (+) Transcript_28542:326-595(+)
MSSSFGRLHVNKSLIKTVRRTRSKVTSRMGASRKTSSRAGSSCENKISLTRKGSSLEDTTSLSNNTPQVKMVVMKRKRVTKIKNKEVRK